MKKWMAVVLLLILLAELLRDSIHEEYAGGVERLAAQENSRLHLETMEEAPNQIPKFAQTRHPRQICVDGGNEQARLLVYRGNRSRRKGYLKRKTRTRRIL